MNKKSEIQHPLVFAGGVLGFQGYGRDGLFTVLANGDNNFLLYGIAENLLLVVNQNLPYETDKLNVFQTNQVINGKKQLKLSLERLEGCPYIGRVILSVNQYE